MLLKCFLTFNIDHPNLWKRMCLDTLHSIVKISNFIHTLKKNCDCISVSNRTSGARLKKYDTKLGQHILQILN